MSESQDTRAERIARYKEMRRQKMAVQYGPTQDSTNIKTRSNKEGSNSSSSDGPRPTRASKLRLAALSQDNASSQTKMLSNSEKSPSSPFSGNDSRTVESRRVERDKSNKRKSNLNRSLTSEEVPPSASNDDLKNRRRRRRFFPHEVLEQCTKDSGDEINRSEISPTASSSSHPPTSPITASSPSRLTPRKSELSVHMENARRGLSSSHTEMNKYKPFAKLAVTSSPKPSFPNHNPDLSYNKTKSGVSISGRPSGTAISDDGKTKIIASRMEELSALTRQTRARIERLTNKSKESPNKDLKKPFTNSHSKPADQKIFGRNYSKSPSVDKSTPSSILKKKVIEETSSTSKRILPMPSFAAGPVSILKRKVSQDDHKLEGSVHASTHTPPVTFSPSVVEPSSTKRKQGILKKRRSLDESTVLRHRSCSPDAASKSDSRSILKNQRRSSLEELRRTQSPEIQLQSILKRKTSRNDDDDASLNSPQSILKRRSGASSVSSTGSGPHVSITTAVILAAAGGAEMILEPENDRVKPILKKKSFSEEHSSYSDIFSDVPKPILKKKSSTDTDDSEEKPKPILKLPKSSLDRETLDTDLEIRSYKHVSSIETECEVKPILKQTGSREESPRPRLSFCGEGSSIDNEIGRVRTSRRSHTICTDFNVGSFNIVTKEEDRLLRKSRPLSEHDLATSFENTCSTGAIPKRSGWKRNNDRYRTQPVTSGELEASLNLVKSPQFNEDPSDNHNLSNQSRSFDVRSLLDFTTSLEDDSTLNSFFHSSLRNANDPESLTSGKMSSDSAFQSLGDGLELEQEDDISQSGSEEISKTKSKLEKSKLELQMKSIAEEAKKMRLAKGNAGIDRYRSRKCGPSDKYPSRFSTQPVMFEEVQKASRIMKNDGKASEDNIESKKSERKSILKTGQEPFKNLRNLSPPGSKSVLKKYDSSKSFSSRFSILDAETSPDKDDEGISCNGSGSDSDCSSHAKDDAQSPGSDRNTDVKFGKLHGDSTSEGESSGGREIRNIFKNDSFLKIRQTLENALSKSKSQDTFGNDYSGLPHKRTVNIRRSHTQNEMPRTIADLRAKLQERGESEWKKRIPLSNNATDELKFLKEKNRYNDELSEKSLLAAKKDELDASSNLWKSRVEKSDAEKLSVVGKMGEKIRDAVPSINIVAADDNKKKTPQPKRFRLKEGAKSIPTSPEKTGIFDLTRSKSVPYTPVSDQYSADGDTSTRAKIVPVFSPDDCTFQAFFKSVEPSNNPKQLELSLDDLDAVQRQSLLVIKKNVQVRKRRGASKNPIKALASRTDISHEYTEIITGVAEREKKRLNIEKLAKNSNKALEALAGLASNEDFKSVALKKSSGPITLLPWKSLMLLQIKGRRHVQTRLVEPVANSINEGDSFLLITPTALYNYNGAFANVIEVSRAADIANHIQKTADMGCKVSEIITINGQHGLPKHTLAFWQLLGAEEIPEISDCGHPSEDEIYETNILHTNMIYTLEDDELVPYEKYWGSIPKFEMLQDTRIIIFDFGSEMYVWSGKNALFDKKRRALKLAKGMWEEGYDYSECNICPFASNLPRKCNKRPDWALFTKITQHGETVLFREKFLDWPDFSRVIRLKNNDNIREVSPTINITACDVDEILKQKYREPDLIVQNSHLGRGSKYFDEETRRLFEYETSKLEGWRILENTSEKLNERSLGQFYDGDSYIYSWSFRQTVKGRELNGNPSKHAAVGRDRCIFFCWQGSNSSINEKGTAAFLTVELDEQNAPQVRVLQGMEPAAFLRLFEGNMVIHMGKRDETENTEKPRLFIVRGEVGNEIYLMEVPVRMSSLRSRSSFAIIDIAAEQITIWHGAKASEQTQKVIRDTISNLLRNKPNELYLDQFEEDLDVVEMDEGSESEDFFDIMGNNRECYFSLMNELKSYDYTMRLFRMSSITGIFQATEILCLHRSGHFTPYPFVQSELYSASQPALFLIDNHHELWLWQGWWPERDNIDLDLSEQTGSGAVRWQAERRAAMETAVNYWRKTHDDDAPVVAYLVWAGMEPLRFKNLFPAWEDREDVMELNKKEGKKLGEMLSLEKELALLSRTTYPIAELLQRPLPEGVDPTHIEKYLAPADFKELLSMSKDEFDKLPSWKKTTLKKEKGLF